MHILGQYIRIPYESLVGTVFTVPSAVPQTALWGGPARVEIRTQDRRSRGSDIDH